MRFKIVKDILWQPIWGVVLFVVAIVGNIEPVLDIIEFIIGRNLTSLSDRFLSSKKMTFFITYWIPALIVIFSIVIAEGIFRKTRYYLGEKVITKNVQLIPKEENPSDGEIYAWLSVENGEELDIENCYADLRKVLMKYGEEWFDWTEMINRNLSKLTWPDFDTHKDVFVRRNNEARLNVARTRNRIDVVFIFEKGDESVAGKEIFIEVAVNGTIDGKSIEELIFTGFLTMETGLIPAHKMHEKLTTTTPDGEVKVEESIRSIPPKTHEHLHFRAGEFAEYADNIGINDTT